MAGSVNLWRSTEGIDRLAKPMHARVRLRSAFGFGWSPRLLLALGVAAALAVCAALLGEARLQLASALIVFLLLIACRMRALAGERDRLAADLERSERLFARLWDGSPAGTLYFDALGRPVFANDGWSALTGLDDPLTDEHRWLDAIATGDRGTVNSLWARARATLEPCAGEITYLRKGAPGGHAEIAFYPDVEADQILGFAARMTDISARRRDKVAQDERDASYRLLSENGRDVVVRLTLEGRASFVSGAALRVMGYAPSEIVGRPLADFVHPEDLAVFERSLSLLAQGRPEPLIEFRLRHRDGHHDWFESSQRLLFDREGEPSELVTSLRPIGRRRRAEAAAANAAATRDAALRILELVDEAAGVGHWRFDRTTHVLDTSPHLHRILGDDLEKRLQPITLLRNIHADDRRALMACLARARRAGGRTECVIRLTVRDTLRRVRVVAQAEERGGGSAAWSGIAEDIGEAAPHVDGQSGRRALNVLVAQDGAPDPLIVATVGSMGHSVLTVATGRQAVAAARRKAFDVILLDMRLPEMDALAVTRAIRASAGPSADTIIIALSDDISTERKRFCDGAGFTHVLAKPVDRAIAACLDAIAAMPVRRAVEPIAAASGTPLIEAERISELRKVLGGERLEALMGLLIAECLDRPGRVRKAHARGELAAIRAEGHGLKGAALSIGAIALGRAAEQLEAVASIAEAGPLIAVLEECADSTRNAVLTLISSPTDDRASA